MLQLSIQVFFGHVTLPSDSLHVWETVIKTAFISLFDNSMMGVIFS